MVQWIFESEVTAWIFKKGAPDWIFENATTALIFESEVAAWIFENAATAWIFVVAGATWIFESMVLFGWQGNCLDIWECRVCLYICLCSNCLDIAWWMRPVGIYQGLFCHDQGSLGKFLAFFNLWRNLQTFLDTMEPRTENKNLGLEKKCFVLWPQIYGIRGGGHLVISHKYPLICWLILAPRPPMHFLLKTFPGTSDETSHCAKFHSSSCLNSWLPKNDLCETKECSSPLA